MSLLADSARMLAQSIWSRGRHGIRDCPVCGGRGVYIDSLDFNKSCEDHRGGAMPPSGEKVPYHLCVDCFFCFAPTMAQWDLKCFAERIYNNDYINVDPDYVEKRPLANARFLAGLLGEEGRSIIHLDYGGGSGLLSRFLAGHGWNTRSYDPFVDGVVLPTELINIDLVTAFEVFEHVPDPKRLMADLVHLLADNGVLLFSTLISDGQIDPRENLRWWYAAPRNGHISLFSMRSLQILAGKHDFNIASFSPGLHMMWRGEAPPWAARLFSAVPDK